MATSKEQCFEDALDAYQKTTGKDLGIQHRAPWVQGLDGTWKMAERGFWAEVNSMLKTVRSFLDPTGASPPGQTQQVRVPDLTVNGKLVVDTKFTRGDGKVDTWGTKPGAGNGRTQREDYNDINRQQNKGDPKAQDMVLDPETCGCKAKGEPKPVEVPVMAPYALPNGQFYMVPTPLAPGVTVPGLTLPGLGGILTPAPMPGFVIP
jgi:hypothetical protein